MWLRLGGRRASPARGPAGDRRAGRRRGRPGGSGRRGLLAETAASLILGAALALVLLAAALVLLALAVFGRFALAGFTVLTVGAAFRLFLLALTVFLLAAAGIGQRIGACVALLVGKGAQHDAGTGRIRGGRRRALRAARSGSIRLRRCRPWRRAEPPGRRASRPGPRDASPSRPRPPSSGRARSSGAPCLARPGASKTASWATRAASCRPGSSYHSFRFGSCGFNIGRFAGLARGARWIGHAAAVEAVTVPTREKAVAPGARDEGSMYHM